MAGFLDPTYESVLVGLPDNFGVQTLAFVNNVLKGILYASMSAVGRVVTGQVKNGDGTNHTSAVSVNLFCDQVMTLNTGTTTTVGNSSIQITTNASGVFQVTIAGTQGATLLATAAGGVGSILLVGSGGTGGGFGGGGGGGAVTDGDYGDVTVSGSGTVWTIDSNAVSLSKLAQISTSRFLGRITASTGNVESLTTTQATSMLDSYTGSLKGLVPAGSGSVLNFLREDGTWAVSVPDGDKGDITVASAVWTIDANAVSLSKMAQISTDRLLGRDTAATGNVEELTVGGGVEFTGSGGIQRSALTGDVAATAGSNTTAIGANKVLNTMIRQSAGASVIGRAGSSTGNVADITAVDDNQYLKRDGGGLLFDYLTPASISSGVTTARIMGRVTAGTGPLEQLTGTQATTLIDTFTTLLKGSVPAPGSVTGLFLKDDGTWASPTVGMTIGGAVTSGTTGSILFVAAGPVLAQNNAAFFWENTNKVLKITQSAADPADGTGAITLQNTLSTSLAQISWRHSNAVFVSSIGHSNAGGVDGGMYWDIESSTSVGLVFSSVVGGSHMQILSGAVGGAGFQMWSGANTVVSDSNTGRLRYFVSGQKFQVSLNTSSYLDLAVCAAPLSTNAIPFADASGYLTQSAATFNYDNVSKNINSYCTTAGQTALYLKNTLTTGVGGFGTLDSTGTFVGYYGYFGSAYAANTAMQSKHGVLCWTNTNFILGNSTIGQFEFGMTVNTGFFMMANGSSAATSAANTGRIRYNTTGQKFQASGNAVAYKDISLLAAALTAGSVPFADSTGALAQDNANLFWDDANDRLGIGTNAFSTNAVIGGGLSPMLSVRNTGTTRLASILLESFDSVQYPSFIGYRSRGTPAAPSPLLSGDIIFLFQAYGQQNSTVGHIVNAGYMRWEAAENWSGSAHGTRLGLWTVANTTVTVAEKLAIENDGGITFANSATAAVSAASTGRVRYNTTGQKFQMSANAVAYKDVSLLAAALTTGSVPFADSTGALAQDNTNHFWDNTNKRLGLGTASPTVMLHVKGVTTAQTAARLEHSAVAGYAATTLFDSAAAQQGMMGYGNASVALTHLQSKNFLHSSGPIWVVANDTGVALSLYSVNGSAAIGFTNGSSLAVSAAGEARLRYNSGTDKLQVSKNGAAYVDII